MLRNHLAEASATSTQNQPCCRGMFDWLCKLHILLCKRPKRGDPCLYLPERVINRPDPCIYSQFMLMQLSQPVTWDNPDIALFRGGVEQYTYDLVADTEYTVEITVHNSSRKKPADGTLVVVRWIEFGAGAQIRHPIATLVTNVPVWPGVSKVATTWRTPATPGHFCIEVELSHPDDGNPANNRGWNNTQVKAAASQVREPVRIFNRWLDGCPPVEEAGRKFNLLVVLLGWGLLGAVNGMMAAILRHTDATMWTFAQGIVAGYLAGFLIGFAIEAVRTLKYRMRNQSRLRRDEVPCNLVELTVDSYVFHDRKGREVDPAVMFAQRPPVWPARLEPHLFHFAENEAYRDVHLIVDAPDEPGPSEVFNISARQGGMPTGGVSVTVSRRQEG